MRRIHPSMAVLAVIGICLATAGQAQARGERPSGADVRALWSRMSALTDSMRDFGPSESFAAYFPREGTWVWRQTLRAAPGGDRVGRWRFPAAQTAEALSDSGPLCPSFFRGGGEAGARETSIAGRLSLDSARWRRIGARFVPPGSSASSPAFVEWRREGERWVISAFGDERTYPARQPAPPRPMVRRSPVPGALLTLPLPPDTRYAATAPWFVSSEMISLGGVTRVKYGLPRHLQNGDVTRIGWIDGVPVYTEPWVVETAEIIYVPVDAGGAFQPYYPASNYFCH